jgi:hypothetical protein
MRAKTKELVIWLLQQDDKEWEIEEYKEKKHRSLDSNAYFHVLVQKLAQVQDPPISFARCKNEMIASYGQPEYIDETQVIIKSNLPAEKMLEQEYLHVACVKIEVEKGKEVYFYRVYRGSHTYNSWEMAKLIKGVVQECQQVGIETATSDEIAHMQMLWENKIKRKEDKKQ